jgi:hypothetical protein
MTMGQHTMSDKKEPHPLPLTRKWVEDYQRATGLKPEETSPPHVQARARDLFTVYGLNPRLVEWFEATDPGSCHCGRPGVYVEPKANTRVWYCPDHRPNFRVCHICGQRGVAFECVDGRWLWFCEAHNDGVRDGET